MSEVVISVKNIRKSYRHYKNNWQRIRSLLFKQDVGRKKRVLRGISFDVCRGEKVGIIGMPSTGRTTLMRILSGVIKADSGTVEIDGKVTSVLNHRTGFQLVMNGHDNYRLRAKLLGWTEKEIDEHEQAVFEFAGLEKWKNYSLKQYKKGWPARLGFAIETEMKPEILIYDELFVFGSKTFSMKAVRHLKNLIEGDDTTFVMTVNHRAYAEMLCERGIVIDKGKVVFDGPFKDALEYYDTNVKIIPKKD